MACHAFIYLVSSINTFLSWKELYRKCYWNSTSNQDNTDWLCFTCIKRISGAEKHYKFPVSFSTAKLLDCATRSHKWSISTSSQILNYMIGAISLC